MMDTSRKEADQFKVTLPSQTNIDRRKCSRVLPMEVLVLGLPRTGTSAIQAALKQLGYRSIYHMRSVKDENPRDAEMWLDAFQRKAEGKPGFGRKEFDQLLGHCDALSDMPAAFFAAELIQAYPEAKVILSLREFNSWKTSVSSTIMRNYDFWFDVEMWLYSLFNPTLRTVHRMQALKNSLQYKGSFDVNAREYFDSHNQVVKSICPPNRLLEFRVQDGWEPLARFLGKDIPDTPFPCLNDRDTWHDRFKQRRLRDRRTAVQGLLKTTLAGLSVVAISLWLKSMYAAR